MDALEIDDESAISEGRSLKLVVPPNPRYASLVRQRFADFAREHAVPESELMPFVIALGEALANAVEHGGTESEIAATCSLEGNQLVATVVDGGAGFVHAERRMHEARTPEPTAERGRGLAIMRHCADHVAVRSMPGKGTAVTLVRYLRPRGSRRVTRVTPGGSL